PPLLAAAFHLPALAVFFALLWFYCICAATSQVGWMAWVGDLVPPAARGEFFARRNALGTLLWLPLTLGGGLLLDFVRRTRGPESPYGFLLIFGAAAVAGFVSLALMTRVRDPRPPHRVETRSFTRLVPLPFAGLHS